jgi:hypothetical protein
MQQVVVNMYVNVFFSCKCHSNAEKPSVYTVKKSTFFWYKMPCSPLKVNQRFGGTYYIHLQEALLTTCVHAGISFGLFFDPEDGGDIFLRNVG